MARFYVSAILLCATTLTFATGGHAQTGPSRPTQQTHTTAAPATAHTYKLKKATIDSDIGGFPAFPQFGLEATPTRHITAVSMLTPLDWTFKVLVDSRPIDCNLTQGRFSLLSMSPDQAYALVTIPVLDTLSTNDPGTLQSIARDNQTYSHDRHCTVEQPLPLATRLPRLLKSFTPSANLQGSVGPIPGLNEKLAASVARANAELAQQARGGPPTRISAEAGRIRFTSPQGEGYAYAVQVLRTQQLPSGVSLTTISMPMFFVTGTPAGKLDSTESLFLAMSGSIEINPQYTANFLESSARIMHMDQVTKQKIQRIQQEIIADNARTQANISSMLSGAQKYQAQVGSNIAANRSAALEHSSQQYSLYMGDQAQYRDNAGHNVILPGGADHVWASTTGNTNEYILTDSSSYNPNGQAGSAGWTQMQMQH